MKVEILKLYLVDRTSLERDVLALYLKGCDVLHIVRVGDFVQAVGNNWKANYTIFFATPD